MFALILDHRKSLFLHKCSNFGQDCDDHFWHKVLSPTKKALRRRALKMCIQTSPSPLWTG